MNHAPTADVAGIAERLREAQRSGEAISAVRDELPANDVAIAYAIQEANTEHWLAEGRRLVGRKIGLTSAVVQRQLGVDQPDFGMLFADMAVLDGDEVPVGTVLQPRAEAEVAFVMGGGLAVANPTVPEVIGAIDYALPAIEIVGSRIRGWDIGIVDTVADNASSGLFVLGTEPRRVDDLDLRLCGMVLEQNGVEQAFGAGAACLGNPLHAVRWLAGIMTEVGRPLQAGDIVLSGALGPMVTAAPGDRMEARISGLGRVSVRFGADEGGTRG